MERSRGSITFLSDTIWEFDNESVEVEICEDGSLVVTGYPQDEFLKDLKI